MTPDGQEIVEEDSDLNIELDARENLERFCVQLGAYVPDPTNKRLLDPEYDYAPIQLSAMLQEYGSYIANLSVLRRRMESEDLILRRSAKITKTIILGQNRTGHGTLAAQDALVIASAEGFPIIENEKRMIMSESCIIIVKGWLEAYEQAYASASRVLAVLEMEAESAGSSNRYP